MSSIKKYNVFIYESDLSIKLIGEYMDKNDALQLFWSTGTETYIGICEVTGDYLNQIRKEKLEKIDALQSEEV